MIVLDTHAWLWWASAPKMLSRKARSAIEAADRIGISPISWLEIATLVRRGRISLDRDATVWIEQALDQERVETVALTPRIAVRAGSLADPFPGDPADRLIYASAVASGARLVTKDSALRRFDPAATLW